MYTHCKMHVCVHASVNNCIGMYIQNINAKKILILHLKKHYKTGHYLGFARVLLIEPLDVTEREEESV